MSVASTDVTTMNKSSIKFAAWALRVSHSHNYNYTYVAKKTGQSVTSYKFECQLVGSTETTYVLAVLKGTKNQVDAAKTQFKDGSLWHVSKIKFDEGTAQTLIGAPMKVCVDLSKSTVRVSTDSHLDGLIAKAAVPPRTVAETANITSTRNTDLFAIVTAVADRRTTKRGEVLDVTLMDASEESAGIYAKVLVSVWGADKQKLVNIGKPLVFLNLTCKVEGDNKQFNHWESSFLCEGPAGVKRDELTNCYDTLRDKLAKALRAQHRHHAVLADLMLSVTIAALIR